MSFNNIHHASARQQLRLLGGAEAVFISGSITIDPVLALVEKNVQVPSESGLTLEKKTIISLLNAEITKASKADQILVGSSRYVVNDILSDDGYVTKVYVRG